MIEFRPGQIEDKGAIVNLVLWVCEPFDENFSFRDALARMNMQVGGEMRWHLPAELPREDFVDGLLEWGGTKFDLYYERSLGYMQFSAASRSDIEALAKALSVPSTTSARHSPHSGACSMQDAGSLEKTPTPPQAMNIWHELLCFLKKEAQACIFGVLFFAAVFIVPRTGVLGVPRYDVLLIAAVAIQIWMLRTGRETADELKAICLFHLLGFVLEAFKTSASIRSWSYPDFAYSKVWGVPLFAGFMYAAVGSYIIQAWRLLKLRIEHHPPYWMAGALASALYLNFFTHHYIGDYRWYLAAGAIGLYARATVVFQPAHTERRMPLALALVLIGFVIWLAENLGTFLGLWAYPHQLGAWALVHMSKWSAWSLLVLMSFTIVTNLKHIKSTVHVPS